MTFRAYLKRNYATACKKQRDITRDVEIVKMVRDGVQDAALVKRWMRDYGLFQGLIARDRSKIVRCFLTFLKSHNRKRHLTEDNIRALYTELFTALYRKKQRRWMSATSKLLWCMYPNDVAMYDTFVHRALLVMQRTDGGLARLPRIGEAPSLKAASDIQFVTAHYMSYQAMVRHLLRVHAGVLQELRERTGERYPYDIRIVDKVLWMIGNPQAKIEETA